MKVWTHKIGMKEYGNINELMHDLDELDTLEGEGGLKPNDIERRNIMRLDLAHKLNREAVPHKQKAREKWLKDGDKNNRYFHCLANHIRRSNYVEDLYVAVECISGNDNIREEDKRFFQKLYREDFTKRPKLDDLQFKRLDEEASNQLEVAFSEEEISCCLRECYVDKASGPDSFNIKFLQDFWPVIKKDVVEMFNEFHKTGSFVKSLDSTFLVLIPKKEGANNVKDFRPIIMVGCVYKLMSKIKSWGRL